MTADPGYLKEPKKSRKEDGQGRELEDAQETDEKRGNNVESNWVTKRVLENVR
eukprot:CAMPEP_0184491288 /NCGR_PEP_ID=MMETSP0113_2-20130426/20052_1 /TAXON_ID=91329 /ORGANISM="Norrisiella sphaerica, Strain BC52" /LENGTH=52 /DNA_ID=CAMNT_0026875585 /DNA_START=36 /DNA_END=191 /DNA_ORIENTATION=+